MHAASTAPPPAHLLRRLLLSCALLPALLWTAGCADREAPAPGTPGAPAEAAATAFDGPVGLELYSLRREMEEDVPGTLARVRAMGFDEVEVPGLYGLTAQAMREALDSAGLRATSSMADYNRLRDDLAGVIADAEALGVDYVVTAWIPHDEPFDSTDVSQAVADFNAWGARLKEAGLQFAYHIHGYEFQPTAEGTLFDRIVRETDPDAVAFQMDVFWVVHPGQDPVALLRAYPDRFPLMHLKDMRQGTPTGELTGHAPEETNVVLGTGMIDFPAVLRAAEEVGVERYYIEDEAPNAMEQLPASLDYLQNLQL
jgi:sugar phosphate isomerase/epimerase